MYNLWAFTDAGSISGQMQHINRIDFIMANNIPIVSGLAPGFGGVPRLLEKMGLSNTLLCPDKSKVYFSIHFLNKLYWLIDWSLRLLLHQEREIIIIHHNSIPTFLHALIWFKFRRVYYFAIDNSFFCDRSYNILNDKHNCYACMGSKFGLPGLKKSCASFPSKKSNLSRVIQKWLVNHSITHNLVYCISKSQKLLIEKHSPKSNVVVVNFSTLEIEREIQERQQQLNYYQHLKTSNLIVFHGALESAKGFEYALNLATAMPNETFLFPFSKPNIEVPSNCRFISMSWNEGLKNAVRSAKVVLCPSIWTYTPEAAFLKSLIWTSQVFYISVEGSFGADIPADVGIKGTGNLASDVVILEEHCKKSNTVIRNKVREKLALDFIRDFIAIYNTSKFNS